jgi:hypothetical protein
LQGIVDCLALGDFDARKVGKRIVLSKDFPNSDRDVHSCFMDAVALVARYGRPNFFCYNDMKSVLAKNYKPIATQTDPAR